MKKTFVIIFFSIFIKSFTQEYKIPQFNFKSTTDKLNTYISLLKIKDKQALIIKIETSSYWLKGLFSNFLVFENNGKVTFYECFIPPDFEKKLKINKRKIRKSKRKFYWDFLQNCFKNDRFSIVQSKLNIRSKPNKDGTKSVMVISDGTTYSLEITQGNKFSAYETYSPTTFIEIKFPGWKERKKIVDLMNDIYNLIEKH
ncbi:MAG: hypothetical protein MK202_02310 [Tenacibaculum sp.]|nr:hypothetical protein [Tenacibaculum sp.]